MTTAIIIPTLDPSSEMLATCRSAVTGAFDGREVIVAHDENRDGFAATCNRGAKEADADVLVFLNDDTIPRPGWLEPLVGATGDGIAGSLLLYPDGSVQHSGVFLRRHIEGISAYNRHLPAPSGPVPAVTGACLAVGRALWDELGGFDEGYRNGYEDVDLCLRARQLGREVTFVAESRVIHLESQSEGRFAHARENIDLLNERWGWLPV